MTTKGHCESSLGSFDECSAAHKLWDVLASSARVRHPAARRRHWIYDM